MNQICKVMGVQLIASAAAHGVTSLISLFWDCSTIVECMRSNSALLNVIRCFVKLTYSSSCM